MSIMISELYEALTEAGSSPQTARRASQAVASLETRMANIEMEIKSINEQIRMLKWMIGLVVVLLVALLGINFQMYMEVLEILKSTSAI